MIVSLSTACDCFVVQPALNQFPSSFHIYWRPSSILRFHFDDPTALRALLVVLLMSSLMWCAVLWAVSPSVTCDGACNGSATQKIR